MEFNQSHIQNAMYFYACKRNKHVRSWQLNDYRERPTVLTSPYSYLSIFHYIDNEFAVTETDNPPRHISKHKRNISYDKILK